MIHVYMRVGGAHNADVDFLVIQLEPENWLSELRTLWRALDVQYAAAAAETCGNWNYDRRKR